MPDSLLVSLLASGENNKSLTIQPDWFYIVNKVSNYTKLAAVHSKALALLLLIHYLLLLPLFVIFVCLVLIWLCIIILVYFLFCNHITVE